MNPMLISAGVGLLGSLFGGSQKTPNNVKHQLDLQNGILQRAIDLYDNTDLAAQDAQTVADYGNGVMNHAMTILGNYDAKAAGAGSPIGKADTVKDRNRAQIAGDAGEQISQLQANLDQTRAARQAALLPNASQAASGAQAASYLDQEQAAEQQSRLSGLGAAATLISSLLPQKVKPMSTSGVDKTLTGIAGGVGRLAL